MIAETQDRRSVESAVIGCMIFLPEAAEIAAAELDGGEFCSSDLRIIFRAVFAMTERGVPVDAVTLSEELIRRGDFQLAGGVSNIADVLDSVPHAAHVRFYVSQLQGLHQRDCLRLLSERLTHRAQDPTCEPSATIDDVLNELQAIRAGNVRKSELLTAADALEAMDLRQTDTAVVSTGLSDLDRILRGGLRAGQLIVVGGRPGSGKSTLMAQIILNVAKSHRSGSFCIATSDTRSHRKWSRFGRL